MYTVCICLSDCLSGQVALAHALRLTKPLPLSHCVEAHYTTLL